MYIRVIIIISILAIIGLPIYGFGEFILAITAVICVAACETVKSRAMVVTLIIAPLAISIKLLFPEIHIQEGHNAFFITDSNTGYASGLPKPVYDEFKRIYEENITKSTGCNINSGDCLIKSNPPKDLYAFSANSFLYEPEYSREVNEINFTDLHSLRAGFVNSLGPNLNLNWISGSSKLERDNVPYFVVYRFDKTAIGSTLCWQGNSVRHDPVRNIALTAHTENETCKVIDQHFYGFSFAPLSRLSIRLIPAKSYQEFRLAKCAIELLGIATILIYSLRLHPKRILSYLFFPLASLSLYAAYKILKHRQEDLNYVILTGGDDPLLHWGYGREILIHLKQLSIFEALRGGEDVFYFMPGMRYANALGMIIFGDAQFLWWIMIMLLPLGLWRLLALYTTERFAFISVLAFLVSPIMGWSFKEHLYLVDGWPEPVANVLSIFGLIGLVGAFKNSEFKKSGFFYSGLALALSVAMRPNLIIATVMVVSVAAIHLVWIGRVGCIKPLLAGYSFALLLPLHNYLYGHSFVPLTSSATIAVNLPNPPIKYFNAILQFLSSGSATGFKEVIEHLGSLPGNGFGSLIYFTLMAAGFMATTRSVPFQLIVIYSVGAFVPFLFYTPAKRYLLGSMTTMALAIIAMSYAVYKSRSKAGGAREKG